MLEYFSSSINGNPAAKYLLVSSVTFSNWPPTEKGGTSSNQLITPISLSLSLFPLFLSSLYSFPDLKLILPFPMLDALVEETILLLNYPHQG